MIENLSKSQEKLIKINIELDSLERLLGGCRTTSQEECCEVQREECVMDTTNIILENTENALCTLERINNILKGGVK